MAGMVAGMMRSLRRTRRTVIRPVISTVLAAVHMTGTIIARPVIIRTMIAGTVITRAIITRMPVGRTVVVRPRSSRTLRCRRSVMTASITVRRSAVIPGARCRLRFLRMFTATLIAAAGFGDRTHQSAA